MLSLTISDKEDKKNFIHQLLVDEMFDRFLCCKVTLHHNVDYHIDGHYNVDFFDTDEQADKEGQMYASWAELKPVVYQMMKGKKLPLRFQIVLCCSTASIEQMLKNVSFPLSISQIEGLYVNINYKDESITITTGSAYTSFVLDKSLDFAFEKAVKQLIHNHNIVFTE